MKLRSDLRYNSEPYRRSSTLQYKFWILHDHNEICVGSRNDNLLLLLSELAAALGDVASTEKLENIENEGTICQTQGHESVKYGGLVVLFELSKLIRRNKTKKICAYNTAEIKEALRIRGILKIIRRKLGMKRDRMYACRNEHMNLLHSSDEIFMDSERLARRNYFEYKLNLRRPASLQRESYKGSQRLGKEKLRVTAA